MRLTEKLEQPIETKYLHYDYMRIADYDISRGNYGRITDAEIYNKLGQLEDIEEELGIDLITLFKALKNGVFMSTKHFDVVYCPRPKIVHYKCGWKILVYGATLSLTTYGKTWALTKEELL